MGIVAKFRSYLERSMPCTDTDMALLRRVARARRMKKGQSLLLEGEPFPYLLWVAEGCLRLYLVDERENEHVVDVAIREQFLADRIHLYTGKDIDVQHRCGDGHRGADAADGPDG